MLNTEKQEIIEGCIVYQDYSDPKRFYCLPEEKAKIADNGRGLQYMVYTDNEVLEGDDPDFSKDESRVGGFLTLQVELGPSESKLEAIRSELQSKYGDGTSLSMVPFKDGSVKLAMFGSDGKEDNNNEDINITIAGSTKPSLQLKQTAVFSTRLSNMPAQFMWNLLKEKGQTQVAVCYELDYLGIMKAHNLEITVDFKATEDFWNHTFDLDASLQNDTIKIAASADIDVMLRELINEGAITIKQVDYTTDDESPNLLKDDPTGIKLVKELLGPTLFQPTAIPSENYSAGVNEMIENQRRNEEQDADGDSNRREEPPTTDTDQDTTTDTTDENEEENTNDGDGSNVEEGGVDGTESEHDRPANERETDQQTDEGGSAETNEGETPPETPPAQDPPSSEIERPDTDTGDQNESDNQSDSENSAETENTENALGVDINVGYTLRRREITQQVKRTFTFTKAEAKIHKYYPNGALTVANTQFDETKQLQLVRLNDDVFKKIELEVRGSFNFDDYKVQEVLVHISYGYKGPKGDRSQRVHEHSLTLTKEKKSEKIKFFVDQYGTMAYDYSVEFIHDTGAIIGTSETKITSPVFEDETKRDLSITLDDHSPLMPVEIQPGVLDFSEEGVQSVQVFLAPGKDANGKTTIFKKEQTELRKYLIKLPEENQYNFYAKQEFFFKNEKLIVEQENVKDAQVVINTPISKIFTIKPTLVTETNLVKQALVDIRYTTADHQVKNKTLKLTPTETEASFAISVDEEDSRNWVGKTRFILEDGRLFEGTETTYSVASPIINLDNSGFRTVKIATLLGDATFGGTIAAIQVTVRTTDSEPPITETIFLRKEDPEGVAILSGVPKSVSLQAEAIVFSKNGSQETLNFLIGPNSSTSNASQLMLNITQIN